MKRWRLNTAALLIGAGFTFACAQDRGQADGYLDTAELPERQLVETLRLGGADAPEEVSFQSEPQVAVGNSGLIYVLHYQEGRIAVLDATGQLIRWIGRNGSGPGEFQLAIDFGFVGDTLWVRNVPAPKISRFLTDGTHLSTEQTSYDFGRPLSSPAGISGYLEHGRAWVHADGFVMGEDTAINMPLLVGVRDMKDPDTLFTLPNPRGMLAGVRFAPFAQPPFYSVARNGRRIILADWNEASPTTVLVRLFTPGVGGASAWSLNLSPVQVPDQVRDSLVAAGVDAVERVAQRFRERGITEGSFEQTISPTEVEEKAYLPAYYPPIRSVRLGFDDTVWIERMDRLVGGKWLVFDLAGRPLFQVNVPTGFTLRDASGEVVWATMVDSLDVPYLVRWQLGRND